MKLFDNIEKKLNRAPQILNVLMYPHPVLNEVSKLITSSIPGDTDLQNLIEDMRLTLARYKAAGLAAVQVGVPIRLLLVNEKDGSSSDTSASGMSKERIDKVHVVINPIIKSTKGSSYEDEGCLSIPGVFTRILRPASIEVEYFDQFGYKHTANQSSLLARTILHEIDHLNGLTFLDRMTSVQKASALKKLKVIKRKMF